MRDFMEKEKPKKSKESSSHGFWNSNTMIVGIRFLAFIGMIILMIVVYNNPIPTTFECALWIAVGLMAVIVLEEAWQIVHRTGRVSLYAIYTISFAIALGILAVIGSLCQWANLIAPVITFGGFIAILIIGALFFAQLTLGYIEEQTELVKADQYESFGTKLKLSLYRQRFTSTFLLLVIGLIIIITGNMAKLSWVWNYLIPILLILPFPIILIWEYSKPNVKFDKEWFKTSGLSTVLIESAIMVLIFVLCVFVIWNLFSQDQRDFFEFDSWVIMSYTFTIGFGLLIHSLWGTRRMIKTGNPFLVGFGQDAKDSYPQSNYILTQCILFGLTALNIYYIIGMVRQILEIGISFESGIFLVISAFILILLLEWIEEEYLKYHLISQGEPKTAININRAFTWEGFVFIPLGIIILFATFLRLIPNIALILLDIMIVVGLMFLIFPAIHPHVEITKHTSIKQTGIKIEHSDGITLYKFK